MKPAYLNISRNISVKRPRRLMVDHVLDDVEKSKWTMPQFDPGRGHFNIFLNWESLDKS
jgi:hypothetical protein